MVTTLSRPTVVVLGMMTKVPVAGVVWQTVHYLLGLERLGCEVYYVEAHRRAPAMLMRDGDDGSARAAALIAGVMNRFGLEGRWAFQALHSDGMCYGMSHSAMRDLYGRAALIVNLHGGTAPLPEHAATDRLVYLETDPVRLQIELDEGQPHTISLLEPHSAFYTFAENYGAPDCALPVSDRFAFRTTRQPVVLDLWRRHGFRAGDTYTTVGSWKQGRRDITVDGERYLWSKHHEFLKLIHLPQRSPRRFELALSRCTDEDRALLSEHGWNVRSAPEVSSDPDTYRSYLCRSRAEFTVAKDQNVRMRTGWFSDRSATYLAAGRPVITQDTAFGNVLPTGKGLFAFDSMEDVLAAVDDIERDYAAHCRAAAEIAREYFAHDVVLRPILDDLGIAHRPPRPAEKARLRADLVIAPVQRRPLRLPGDTVSRVLTHPLPSHGPPLAERPRVGIVVVTFDGLVFTRLCLESLLANTADVSYEVTVVDNGSTDGTAQYLEDLAARHPHISVLFNDTNIGFAAANNQGLAASGGDVLVLLNNDTILGPGWLQGLLGHLDDRAVGLVGPVTNRTCNEAQIDARYATLGELVSFAGEASGEPFDIRMLAMFCVAVRRDVLEEVGPLDERFGLGTFEDEDYAVRVRNTGRRVVCAEDVFVHHFGHASFGEIIPSGDYHRLLDANRRTFEQKWDVVWRPYERRTDPSYDSLRERVRESIPKSLPARAEVLVVSKGDDDLLRLEGLRARHFPQTNDGTYAGFYPADDQDAIGQLESLRASGAEFLVIPSPSLWWLDHYAEFRKHLEQRHHKILDDRDTCVVYELRGPAARAS